MAPTGKRESSREETHVLIPVEKVGATFGSDFKYADREAGFLDIEFAAELKNTSS